MKYSQGAFCQWGYDIARDEFAAHQLVDGNWWQITHPYTKNNIIIKNVIADNFLQQILFKPENFEVTASLNLNDEYTSNALAAQVGGIGIAPGAKMEDSVAVFEATHVTAPKHAGKNRVNPGLMILSAEMMLRYIGWNKATDRVIKGISGAISSKTVTYDLARARAGISAKLNKLPANTSDIKLQLDQLMPGATLVLTTGFGESIIYHM